MNTAPFTSEVIQAGGQLLLSVADADEVQDASELNTIKDILMEYFELGESRALAVMSEAQDQLERSIDLFRAGEVLNEALDISDKIDFIRCVYEVGYSDGVLNFREQHIIQKIANILNVEHSDLIAAKIEVKEWFKE